MKKVLYCWIVIALSIFSENALAEFRVGYVQVEKVLKDSPRTIAIGRKLQKEFAVRNAELERLAKQINDQQSALEKNASTMSESERLSQNRNISNLQLVLERKRREQHEDFLLRKSEELSNLQDLINKVVVSVSEADGYDLVIYGTAIYAGKRIDITDKVIKALGN